MPPQQLLLLVAGAVAAIGLGIAAASRPHAAVSGRAAPKPATAAIMLGGWSAGDIENFLETGFTPDFDSVGGSMVAVQRNMAELQKADRAAIAAYLKAVPPQARGF